jgi:hypothetical protein
MKIKATMRYHSLVLIGIIKRQKVTNFGKDLEKGELFYTAGGNVN